MRKSSWVFIALLVAVMVTVPACKAPAEFEVVSLEIVPLEVAAGETVSVTAEVRNTGSGEGVYTAILTVDGADVEAKEVTIAPGASETVTFSLLKDAPGTYQVGIGGQTSSLTVKQMLVAKEFELKYDDGKARDAISADIPWLGGHIVDFSPLGTPFTIKKIRITGMLSSRASNIKGKTFDVEIWDKDQKILYSATYPYTKFTAYPTWVEFEVPDIEVTDRFYAHIYTDSPWPGLHIGADDSVINKHSDTTIRTAEKVVQISDVWPYSRSQWFGNKSKVNWMIRIVGEGKDLGVKEKPALVEQLKVAYPELLQELLMLPDLAVIDTKDEEALEDIAHLALDSKNRTAFESMLNEGIKDYRKYCTPLEALLWIAYDRELDQDNPLMNYSLAKLIDAAWEDTTTSNHYNSERWQNLHEVSARLNSPDLVCQYMRSQFRFTQQHIYQTAEAFNLKAGNCNAHATFATCCLGKNGYESYILQAIRGPIEHPSMGHSGCLYIEDNKYYIIDSSSAHSIAMQTGASDAIENAADYLSGYSTTLPWENYILYDLYPSGWTTIDIKPHK